MNHLSSVRGTDWEPDGQPISLCVRLIDPACDTELPMWGDAQAGWQPPGIDWLGTLAAAGVPFRAGPDASADDGQGLLLLPDPDAVDLSLRCGRPVLTGAPPPGTEARLTLLREALGALVIPDLRGLLVLRLDDPGASVKRHLSSWAHPDVAPAAWAALWSTLSMAGGRMSVFCCPGWITDEGMLVGSRTVSPEEWEHVDSGVAHGLADLECHGFTHLDPDLISWRSAKDRSSNSSWYRELWPPHDAIEPTVEQQQVVMGRWQEVCGRGTTLVAPGEAWGINTVKAARRQGFSLFCSWGVCRLGLPVPTWSTGIGSPYLDEASEVAFDEGLPVVGYWHDRDMAIHGPTWVPEHLTRWRECGARRLVSFADLARAYSVEVDAAIVDGEIVVRKAPPEWPLRMELSRTTGW